MSGRFRDGLGSEGNAILANWRTRVIRTIKAAMAIEAGQQVVSLEWQ